MAPLKKAALAAAFFMAPALRAHDEPLAALQPADARVQRLFDQAVKLHRRYEGKPQHPLEPFHSILDELASYHGEEEAYYFEGAPEQGKRAGPVAIGPWARHRLAQMAMQRGAWERAILDFRELGSAFAGRTLSGPGTLGELKGEPALAAAMRGELQASLALAKATNSKDTLETLSPLIAELQAHFGREFQPCPQAPCPSYSQAALEALQQSLDQDGADQKLRRKQTLKFLKREAR